MTTRFSQCRRALNDGGFEPVSGQPVSQNWAGDAGPGDENPHDALPNFSKLGKPNYNFGSREEPATPGV